MTEVKLQRVAPGEAATLANLLELYCHDLSAVFGLRIGSDGRFGYAALSLYWQEPERRFPFFILADDQLAGFALATRGSPASNDPSHLDVAEFFVLRTYRTRGVGGHAVCALFDEIPGHWVVRVAVTNEPAVGFWRRATAAYAGRACDERAVELAGVERLVLELDSRSTSPAH